MGHGRLPGTRYIPYMGECSSIQRIDNRSVPQLNRKSAFNDIGQRDQRHELIQSDNTSKSDHHSACQLINKYFAFHTPSSFVTNLEINKKEANSDNQFSRRIAKTQKQNKESSKNDDSFNESAVYIFTFILNCNLH